MGLLNRVNIFSSAYDERLRMRKQMLYSAVRLIISHLDEFSTKRLSPEKLKNCTN